MVQKLSAEAADTQDDGHEHATDVYARTCSFSTDELRVTAGAVGVLIDNEDPIRHTFTIKELDIDQELPANTARRVEFRAAPGAYEFICKIEGHEDMKGTIVVE